MPEPIKKFSFSFSAKSDPGLVRSDNQDSFGKYPLNQTIIDSPKGQLFIVADGMGGHEGGKRASTMAVKVVGKEYFTSTFEESVALKEAIEKANSEIFSKSGNKSQFGRMATTCSVLVIKEDKAIIGHVGDSRIYKIENNFIEQLTNDHTKIQEMLREGILTPEEARNYPSKSVLARALGVDEVVKVDIIDDIRLKRGQSYILCTDGLAKVSKGEILNIVSNHSSSDACDILVDLANQRGGKDNITVIIVTIDPDPSSRISVSKPDKKTAPKPVKRSIGRYNKSSKGRIAIIITFFIIVVLLLALYKDTIFSSSSKKEEKIFPGKQITKTTVNEKPKIVLEDTDTKLLEEADRSLKEKDYNNAYIIYKSLLSNESLKEAALKGIDEIASGYMAYADNLMVEKNFEGALKYYQKAEALRPGDEKIKSLIKLCTDRINLKESSGETVSVQNTPPPESKSSPKITVSKFNLPGWIYPGIDKSECSVSSNEVIFSGTSSEKFVVYNKDLFDVTISSDTKIDKPNSAIGLIIGYVSPLDYYVFKYKDGGNYTLLRINGNEIEKLLEAGTGNSGKTGPGKMKLVYTKNLISIYDQNGLLNSYRSVFGIFGKAGIYIDKNSSATFSNVRISGNTELN